MASAFGTYPVLECIASPAALVTDAETFTDAIEDFADIAVVVGRKTEDIGDELGGPLRSDLRKKGLSRSSMTSKLFSM